MMRTNVAINDTLINEAMNLTGLESKRGVVENALKILIQIKKQEQIRQYRGKLKWDDDFEKMRSD